MSSLILSALVYTMEGEGSYSQDCVVPIRELVSACLCEEQLWDSVGVAKTIGRGQKTFLCFLSDRTYFGGAAGTGIQ